MAKRVAVIGAGVVGICCALQLRRDGHEVTVYDPEAPGTQTSFGNAGAISSQSCIPMSGPGILKQVPGWLMDPLGPLAIRMGYLPRTGRRGRRQRPDPAERRPLRLRDRQGVRGRRRQPRPDA